MSVDPLRKDYPQLTPYQFASNSPIAGIDLDGLEFYYAADGKFLGQGSDPKNLQVRLAKVTGKTPAGNLTLKSVTIDGSNSKAWTVIHDNHDDFKKIAAIVYNEADGKSAEGRMEVAGIVSVLENRAKYEKTSLIRQLTIAKGINGEDPKLRGRIDTEKGPNATLKRGNIYSGLILALTSKDDFSKGAYFWDGLDFNKDAKPNGGYKERYLPGFKFTDMAHDLFKQGDNLAPGKTTYGSWNYKYESTTTIGKTTFSKLNSDYKDAQYSGANQQKEVGTGYEKKP